MRCLHNTSWKPFLLLPVVPVKQTWSKEITQAAAWDDLTGTSQAHQFLTVCYLTILAKDQICIMHISIYFHAVSNLQLHPTQILFKCLSFNILLPSSSDISRIWIQGAFTNYVDKILAFFDHLYLPLLTLVKKILYC